MFLTLLLVTFLIALATSLAVVKLFRGALSSILERIVSPELSSAWHRYLDFAICVVGISGGVRVWQLERYITPQNTDTEIIVLNADRWVLEIYRTLIGTLQSNAWLLLVFFVAALIAYVIVRGFELRRAQTGAQQVAEADHASGGE
jgi:hypothetical protein